MFLSTLAQQFLHQAPFAFLTRAVLERELNDAALDEIFGQHADRQYQHELLFSSLCDLLSTVVLRGGPSLRASYLARNQGASPLNVSLTAVYDKLQGVELQTSAALVRVTSERC